MSQPSALVNEVIYRFRKLNPKQERTVIGLSGGADSIALLFCLSRLKKTRFLAVHVTYDIRPTSETDIDYQIAKEAAAKCGVDFVRVHRKVQGVNPLTEADPDVETNLEARAREERYQVFSRFVDQDLCTAENSDMFDRCDGFIATGHHADDQLETLLMRLGRGTGIEGLRGIHEKMPAWNCPRHTIIRPMLNLTRADTEAICRENGLRWATDSTNGDIKYQRNFLRSEVIPLLYIAYPHIAESASNLAKIAASAQRLIDKTTSDMRQRNAEDGIELCRVNASSADQLRTQEDVVIYQWLDWAVTADFGTKGLDQVNYKMYEDVINAIRKYQVTTFEWPGRTIEVTLSRVSVSRSKKASEAVLV